MNRAITDEAGMDTRAMARLRGAGHGRQEWHGNHIATTINTR